MEVYFNTNEIPLIPDRQIPVDYIYNQINNHPDFLFKEKFFNINPVSVNPPPLQNIDTVTSEKKIHPHLNVLVCEICSKSFEKLKNLKRHKKLHSSEKNYKCDKCEASYSRSDHLNRHKITHSEDTKPFKCEICVQRFSNKCHLKKHIINVHGKEKEKMIIKCEKCDSSFNKKSKLSKHMSLVHESVEKYRCYYPFCQRIYHSKGKLDSHIETSHSSGSNNNVSLTNQEKVNLKEQEKKFLLCPIEGCRKSYTTTYNLKVHIKTFHYKMEEFNCSCGRSFKHKCSLLKHKTKCITNTSEELKVITLPDIEI
jgi:general transcription factor IIIA